MINFNLELLIGKMNVMDGFKMSKFKKDRKQTRKGFINNLLTLIKFKIKSGVWV